MTVGMRRSWVLVAFCAVVVAVLAYAWIDGGREPPREIAEPLAVPGAAAGAAR